MIAVGHDCDIALLAIDDDEFWETMGPPLVFGGLPQLQTSVTVVGFPKGGDNISVTAGVEKLWPWTATER